MKSFNVIISLITQSVLCMAYIYSMEKMDKGLSQLCTEGRMNEVVEVLRNKPEEIHKKDFFGRSFLIWAVLTENKDAIRFLIQKSPELLLVKDVTDRIPLCYAAASAGSQDICPALILSPQGGAPVYTDSCNKAKTVLLIKKHYKESCIGLLPKVVLIHCILRPLLMSEHRTNAHKNRIATMLSYENKDGIKPFQYAKEESPLYTLLDPQNIDQWNKEIELLY